MLKGLPAILGPDILWTLRAMGHGDEIAIVDANYPAEKADPRIIRADGISATAMLQAILTVMPLDQYEEEVAIAMQVVGEADTRAPIFEEFETIIAAHEPGRKLGFLERFEFYKRANAGFSIIQTGEARLYGNVILKKGVIAP